MPSLLVALTSHESPLPRSPRPITTWPCTFTLLHAHVYMRTTQPPLLASILSLPDWENVENGGHDVDSFFFVALGLAQQWLLTHLDAADEQAHRTSPAQVDCSGHWNAHQSRVLVALPNARVRRKDFIFSRKVAVWYSHQVDDYRLLFICTRLCHSVRHGWRPRTASQATYWAGTTYGQDTLAVAWRRSCHCNPTVEELPAVLWFCKGEEIGESCLQRAGKLTHILA